MRGKFAHLVNARERLLGAQHVSEEVFFIAGPGDTPEPPTPAGADTGANVSSTTEPARSASAAVLQPLAVAEPVATAAADAKPIARNKKTARKSALAVPGTAEGAGFSLSWLISRSALDLTGTCDVLLSLCMQSQGNACCTLSCGNCRGILLDNLNGPCRHDLLSCVKGAIGSEQVTVKILVW